MHGRSVLFATAATAGAYLGVIRPRLLHWGASKDEIATPFPDAGIVAGGRRGAAMAVTIDAPPRKVWPWLVQMGVDRGGWYSWDRLDKFGRHSSNTIHPEWQTIAVGDHFVAKPDGTEWWEVAALEPERFLSLRMSVDLRGRWFDPQGKRPRFFTDSTWSFLLDEPEPGKTRLIVSGYWAFEPRWLQPLLSVFFLEPSHWIMQTRQYANLKRRAELLREESSPAS